METKAKKKLHYEGGTEGNLMKAKVCCNQLVAQSINGAQRTINPWKIKALTDQDTFLPVFNLQISGKVCTYLKIHVRIPPGPRIASGSYE